MHSSIKGGLAALVLGGAGLGGLSIVTGPPATATANAAQETSASAVTENVVDASATTATTDQDMTAVVTAPPAQDQVTPAPPTEVVVVDEAPAEAPVAEDIAPVAVADATPEIATDPVIETASPAVPANDPEVMAEAPAANALTDTPEAAEAPVVAELETQAPALQAQPEVPVLAEAPEEAAAVVVTAAIDDKAPSQNDFIAQLQAQQAQEPAPEVVTAPAAAPAPAPVAAPAPAPVTTRATAPAPVVVASAAVPIATNTPDSEMPDLEPVGQVQAETPQVPSATITTPTQPMPIQVAGQAEDSGLPRVNQLVPSEQEEATEGEAAEEAVETPEAEIVIPDDAPAVLRLGAPFENPEGLPVVGLMLIDTGAIDEGPSVLFDSGLMATVILDALMADVGLFADAYLEAGMEVGMRVPLPSGATPSDVEVTYSVALDALPQAALLYSNGEDELRRNSNAAKQVMAILATEGRGFVTFQRGLGGSLRAAEAAEVPLATVSRDLDEAEGDAGALRRTLDRAAFTARQSGGSIVVATMNRANLRALQDWAIDVPGEGVIIGPASALMVDRAAYLANLAEELAAAEAEAAEAGEAAEDDAGGSVFGQLPTITD
ncbi:MAG: divergent polysaccharide deacetylase family protein [Yoonia sp.]|uniref:divergent polysaccharide deacetylase family protein n=1 Tax=Yoonia sp. TaxID=2212373 RepID=UPI003EFA288C